MYRSGRMVYGADRSRRLKNEKKYSKANDRGCCADGHNDISADTKVQLALCRSYGHDPVQDERHKTKKKHLLGDFVGAHQLHLFNFIKKGGKVNG